ncbi:phosphatase PAP2 family protein [Streptomyces armeniacus]|uniref:Phosphatase PAP2 family protein n=1 Tax=Streptomyces armeniacus TaxID=83291 RepID=A0A345XLI7_9ACTN|nr:phosphatase PAP2 family protein [Streptomyces armeniacus]AXK32503.1 phosphatase PAP2 family protein [Streptomyces armeniacus]
MTGRPASAVLPQPLRARLGPVAVLAALVVSVVGILHAGHGRPGVVDRWLRPETGEVRSPWRNAALATDFLGEPVGAATLLVLAAASAAGAAMGWAQVALGAHYPTDVLGGWCTALAVVPATAWLVDRTADARRRKRR